MGETGDRAAFLARARDAAGPSPVNLAHPLPVVATTPVPVMRPREAPADLVAAFATAARAADATVDVTGDRDVSDDVLTAIIRDHTITEAVTTVDAAAVGVSGRLLTLGVRVGTATIEAARDADLGITGCVAAIASTGSVVLDNAVAGSRIVGLLPRVHLCIVRAADIVAVPSDVLRTRPRVRGGPPSNLVLVTGPSRTGDIEQILTLGVHGPTALHIVVIGAPAPEHPPLAGGDGV